MPKEKSLRCDPRPDTRFHDTSGWGKICDLPILRLGREHPMAENNLLTQVEERLSDWDHRARLWYRLYYAFGGLAVLTITVASRPGFIADAGWLSSLAWLAAIFQGISTFLVALPKAAAYRAAWRALWLARLEYVESPPSDDSVAMVPKIGAGSRHVP
jgi:hypothetical protein